MRALLVPRINGCNNERIIIKGKKGAVIGVNEEISRGLRMGCARSVGRSNEAATVAFREAVSGVARPANFYRHAKVKRGR